MKILIVGAQHGNETLGVELYDYISTYYPLQNEHIDLLIGNPKAYLARVRYIQSDLNRSYGTNRVDYESRRAKKILKYIESHNFDLVLDIHTTVCDQPPSCIVAEPTPIVDAFIGSSRIVHIVEMPSHIASVSLLGHIKNVVSVEINAKSVDSALLECLAKSIDRFIDGKQLSLTRYVYGITDKIYKVDISEEEAGSFNNFMKHPMGFIPILTGENSYKEQTNYLGFRADKVTKITL